jgi:hypothetical protein
MNISLKVGFGFAACGKVLAWICVEEYVVVI